MSVLDEQSASRAFDTPIGSVNLIDFARLIATADPLITVRQLVELYPPAWSEFATEEAAFRPPSPRPFEPVPSYGYGRVPTARVTSAEGYRPTPSPSLSAGYGAGLPGGGREVTRQGYYHVNWNAASPGMVELDMGPVDQNTPLFGALHTLADLAGTDYEGTDGLQIREQDLRAAREVLRRWGYSEV